MKAILLISLISLINLTMGKERFLQESYEQVKQKAKWQSYEWDENPFKDYSYSQIKSLVSLKLSIDEKQAIFLIDNDDHSIEDTLPRDFDSRKQWPDCISEVRNQQKCGSCWAFSASSTLSDRFCIATKGKLRPILSPQDFISCDSSNFGCEGGQMDRAWGYLEKNGIVEESCFPYQSADGKNIPKCPQGNCVDSNSHYVKYKARKNTSKPLTCSTQIKKEIFNNGPIQTGLIVYEDFMHYKSGIYEYNHGRRLGGHAVKIVGWGEEEGNAYWIVQNSWGDNWGEEGFFRIKMGECLIEKNGFAGDAEIEDFSPNYFLW